MANKSKCNQYQPFDALKGFSDTLREKEKERNYVDKKVLSDERIETINNLLCSLKLNEYVSVIYYKNISFYDKGEYVTKGEYVEIRGNVKRIDIINQKIKISNDCQTG